MIARTLTALAAVVIAPSLALADARPHRSFDRFTAATDAAAAVAPRVAVAPEPVDVALAMPTDTPAPTPRKPWIKASRAANVAANGLAAGWLVGSKLFTSPVRQDLDAAGWIELQGAFNATTQPWTAVMMSSAIITGVPQLVMDHDFKKPAVILGAAGTLLNVAVIVTTLLWNVPVNDVTETADPQNPPANWRSLRRQWETAHTARSIFSATGFALNLLALTFE